MVGRQERYFGNILLYDYLSTKRAPVLLNRNLTRAFRIDRQILENSSDQDIRETDHPLRAVWEPPMWDALDEMVEQDRLKARFVLEVHGIKPMQTQDAVGFPERNEPARKARIVVRAKSSIRVTIFSPPSDVPCLSIPARDAILQATARQADRAVSVETDRFTITPELFDPPGKITESFRVNISINISTQNEAEELCSYFSPHPSLVQDPSTRLSATWENALSCPTGKTILPLRDWKGSLGFGLEVTMHRTMAGTDSILAMHNRQLRAQMQLSSLPTPPHRPETSQSPIKLRFLYANETVVRSGLICPHCQRRRFVDINDLRMHLDGWHEYFKYQTTKEGLEDDGPETWIFQSEISDHKAYRSEQRASARADEPFDIRIKPPPEPFNEHRYLDEGIDDYQRMSKVNKRYPISGATMGGSPSPAPPRRKPPDQIQSIPAREKRRHIVPEAPPGITFFRSCSRRPLKAGECISESDDETDDTWIKLRKSAEFNKDKQLSDAAKHFLKAYDGHMWEERLQSDIHVGDALTRFVREKSKWIWQEQVFDAFKEKVDELLQDGIISKEIHTHSLSTVESHKPPMATEANEISHRLAQLNVKPSSQESLSQDPPSTQPLQHKKTPNPKGKAKITSTGHLTPLTADSDGDMDMRDQTLTTDTEPPTPQSKSQRVVVVPYDLCLCGKDAQASNRDSPMVACSGMVRHLSFPLHTH
jgi:hypothetical protein